jgi:hypothetical protein
VLDTIVAALDGRLTNSADNAQFSPGAPIHSIQGQTP